MLRNQIEFIAPDEIKAIHDTSMKLLANVGIVFHNDEAIAVFERHGFKTDGYRVYFSEEQVMNAVRNVPKRFTIHARNPERSVTIGDGEPVFVPGYGAPFIMDYELGRRAPTMTDYHNAVRLAHMLPNQDMSGHMLVEPGDVPSDAAHLHMLLSHMVHSDKPFLGSTEGVRGARHTMEMLSILFGEQVGDRALAIGTINSLSPLSYGGDMTAALMEYARYRQPVFISPAAMAGSTGPVTLAGVLAMDNAEALAGITLAQLVAPGTPVLYGSVSNNMDMRKGSLCIGSPEFSVMLAAHSQLARFYGLPCRGGGALTDSHIPDAQAGFESMFSLITLINSGVDFVLHAGGILSSFLAFSFEKFVIDDEMCDMVRRYRRGLSVTPETLAYDVIAKVGPGGNFLTEKHTVKRCHSEFWRPMLCYRDGFDAWQKDGQPDIYSRAHQRCQELLTAHQAPPLDNIIARQLQEFVKSKT